MTTGDHAVRLAERLGPVLPLHEPVGNGCSCANPFCSSVGKHPRTPHGVHDASRDPSLVRSWWTRWPSANIGVATGGGIVVLDVDPRHGGDASLAELEEEHGKISTLTARTGGGGMHLYLRGELPARGGFRPGLDLKAAGGFVVAPPSMHASGHKYTWEKSSGPIAPVPLWLAQIIQPPRAVVPIGTVTPIGATAPPPIDANTPRRRAYVAAAIEAECLDLAQAPEGSRNNRLNEAAFSLARFVHTGEADPGKLAALLRDVARGTGLPECEIERTIESAFRARSVAV